MDSSNSEELTDLGYRQGNAERKAHTDWRGSRALAVLEISFVLLCVLVAEWAVLPFFGRNSRIGMIPVVFVFMTGSVSHRLRLEGARELGFRWDNFLIAMRVLILWMICAGALLVLIGWHLKGLHFSGPHSAWASAASFPGLCVWGLMQQYALQSIVNRRAQILWGKGAGSILFAATIFGVLHLPNLWLALATFLGGLVWAATYQRVPNLFALALSHAGMTVVLASTIPANLLHGMRVGYNYFSRVIS